MTGSNIFWPGAISFMTRSNIFWPGAISMTPAILD